MSKVVLGVVEHRPTYLYVKSLEDAGFKLSKSVRVSSEWVNETTIDVTRHFCEDGIVLIPRYDKLSVLDRALSLTGQTVAAAGGLATVVVLAPILAVLKLKDVARVKLNLLSIGEVLNYYNKELNEVIVVPRGVLANVTVEKPKFGILTLLTKPFNVFGICKNFVLHLILNAFIVRFIH